VAHELLPAQRPAILECQKGLKSLILSLRLFLDEEDWTYVQKAHETKEQLKLGGCMTFMAGFQDLENNIDSIYNALKQSNGNVDRMLFGHLSNQAVYAITRANLIATGLEFKLKRMRKG